ncbi:hypothetical protein WI23_19955 [Burkholderia oklahomensis C6786]|nr:hypothetical protein WI23_19955 [Burkholderia oklahomensis C6786]KUY49961.1 hypothetical protein WI23_02020 [Burkholderia oklahomensis C6786]
MCVPSRAPLRRGCATGSCCLKSQEDAVQRPRDRPTPARRIAVRTAKWIADWIAVRRKRFFHAPYELDS